MHAPATPAPLQSLDNQGNGLQICFEWSGDRFQHRIERVHQGITTCLIRSIELGTDENAPASPPIQQLSVEPIGETMTALGVGSAGKGHWSISISPTEHDGRKGFVFDIAARASEKPSWLGSTYQSLSRDYEIALLPQIAPSRSNSTGDTVQVSPTSTTERTCRWAFMISLRPADQCLQ